MIKKNYKTLLLCTLCAPAWLSTTVSGAINPAHVQPLSPSDSRETIIEKAANVIPSDRQLAYHKREFSGFIHFGPNSFTGVEWGDGMEDPAVFNPTALDTDQWCKTMGQAGMKTVVITVKHHDGFVLWQSRYTKHGVMSSPFEDGKGDILREMVNSCRAEGLKIGVYISPADLYQMESEQGLYGNRSAYSERVIPKPAAGRLFADARTFSVNADDYNEYFMSQLFEVLTEYGPIHEVWFDGAHPKRKGGQAYIRHQWFHMIRELAPEAVIFGGPDVRWVGNESGDIRDSEWSIIPTHKGKINLDRADKDLGSRDRLFDPSYEVYGEKLIANQLNYIIAEVDTSIRDGWFYRDDIHQDVRNADDVFDIYERSVGGNGVLLLNIPPNTEGKFSRRDVDVLIEVGERIRETYGTNLLKDASGPIEVLDNNESSFWQTSGNQRNFELNLKQPVTINRFVLQEAIAKQGQRIEAHALDAWIDNQWQQVAKGTTVGYKKILRFADVTTDKLRLRIPQSRLQATVMSVSGHHCRPRPTAVVIRKDRFGKVSLGAPEYNFNWKPAAKRFDNKAQLSQTRFHYTLDGSAPTLDSQLYQGPFAFNGRTVKARAFLGNLPGEISTQRFSINKDDWKLLSASSEQRGQWYQFWLGNHAAKKAFDDKAKTFWLSADLDKEKQKKHYLALDLGKQQEISAFSYLPRQDQAIAEGMIEAGHIEISDDGKTWKMLEPFKFGNILNNPVERIHYFEKAISTRYIKITSTDGAQGTGFAGAAEISFLP